MFKNNSETPASFLPEQGGGKWYWVDVPKIAEYLGLPRTTPLLEVVSTRPKQAVATDEVREGPRRRPYSSMNRLGSCHAGNDFALCRAASTAANACVLALGHQPCTLSRDGVLPALHTPQQDLKDYLEFKLAPSHHLQYAATWCVPTVDERCPSLGLQKLIVSLRLTQLESFRALVNGSIASVIHRFALSAATGVIARGAVKRQWARQARR